MPNIYASYPIQGGGAGGVPTYATFAAFPVSAADGTLAVALDTNILYEFDAGTTAWVVVANPAYANAITALTSDVTATGPGSVAATVVSVGGSSAANIHSAELAANAATNLNTASTIVKRDASGNFAAGTITASLTGAASLNVLSSAVGAANGVAPLDAGSKVPAANLPSTLMNYRGAWNASTNSPTLADGTGTNGDVWRASVAGTQNLGSGSQTWAAGDFAIYNGSIWQHSPAADGVSSVNGYTGAVSLALDDLNNVSVLTPALNNVLAWNGSEWVNTSPSQGQGIGVVYYPSGVASDISGYRVMDVTPAVGTEVIETVAVTTGTSPVLIRAFASPASGLQVTSINAGDWIASNWALVSAGTTCKLQFNYYTRTAGGVETLLFSTTSATLTTAVLEQDTESIQPSYPCNLTDRLVIKVYATNTSATSRNVSYYYDGQQHYSHFHTPFIVAHNDLSGLQGGSADEYYHLTNAQHTVATQAASASVNGFLSSTDWSTFNSKQSTITTGTLSEDTSSVLTIVGGTGSVIGSGTTIQVKQASGSVSGYLSSTDWTTFNGKQAALGFTPAHSGANSDITSLSALSTPLSATQGGTGQNSTATFPTSGIVVTEAASETLTNKTLIDPELSASALFDQIATPANPASGKNKLYVKSDNKAYLLNSAGVETAIGTGTGTGAVNYIAESDFEDGLITGWVRYVGGTTTPTNGTGGSPNANVTFTASSSSPLRGTYSGLLTKDANNRQGEGVNYGDTAGFAINTPDQSRVLQLSFDFATSANYAAGDVVVYLYDVTNSALIAPSVTSLAAGIGTYSATFVTSGTGTNYRLILHIATTNALAYTAKIDNVYLGPSVLISAPAIGPWTSYTPSVSPISGYSNGPFGFYRRIGDSAEIVMQFQKNGSGGTGAGTLTFAIPSGLTIDSTKCWSGGTAGFGVASTYSQLATNQYDRTYIIDLASSSTVEVGKPAGGAFVGTDVAANSYWTLHFTVPISQWSVNSYTSPEGVEYASNSDTSDGNDTTHFVPGPAGSTYPAALSTGRSKRIRFSTPIQPTDMVVLELQRAVGSPWTAFQDAATGVGQYTAQNTADYGVGLSRVVGSSTDIDVVFGRYSFPSGTTFGAAGAAWATTSGNWRVKKCSAGALAGFNVATTSQPTGLLQAGAIPGNSTGTTVPAGYVGEKYLGTMATGSLTTGTDANFGSFTLPIGIYLVVVKLHVTTASGTVVAYGGTSLSTTTATMDFNNAVFSGGPNAGSQDAIWEFTKYLVVTTPTLYYAVGRAVFSVSTATSIGSDLYAIRIS